MRLIVLLSLPLLFVFSCKEKEKKSRLDIPFYEGPNYEIPTDNFPPKNKRIPKSDSNLSYWDKYNLEILEQTITVPDDTLLSLKPSDFDFTFSLDTCFFYDQNLASGYLMLEGKIKNKTDHNLFFEGYSCYTLGSHMRFGDYVSYSPFMHCNISVSLVEVLKAKETFRFKSEIAFTKKTKEFDASFVLNLISKDVDLKKIIPVKTIELNSHSEKIPVGLQYTFDNYPNN